MPWKPENNEKERRSSAQAISCQKRAAARLIKYDFFCVFMEHTTGQRNSPRRAQVSGTSPASTVNAFEAMHSQCNVI